MRDLVGFMKEESEHQLLGWKGLKAGGLLSDRRKKMIRRSIWTRRIRIFEALIACCLQVCVAQVVMVLP